jgi:hypothetical protein
MKPLILPDEFFGITNTPAHLYHQLPGVSASMLRKYWRSTPAHARVAIESTVEETDAMVRGSMIHQLTLEPTKPIQGVVEIPQVYPAKDGEKPWHNGATYCKNWIATQKANRLQPVTRDELEKIQTTARTLVDRYAPIFAQGIGELTACCHLPELDVSLRCRLDWVHPGSTLYDLKTARDASEKGFDSAIWDNGYHLQAAMYLDVWNAIAGEENRKDSFAFIAIEPEPPYASSIVVLSPDMIALGREAYLAALVMHCKCVRENNWPGYESGRVCHPKPWQLDRSNWFQGGAN